VGSNRSTEKPEHGFGKKRAANLSEKSSSLNKVHKTSRVEVNAEVAQHDKRLCNAKQTHK